ncbi:hypothetical protein Trydic_g10173 [Trypoxylus dichotomus]
MIPSSTVQLTKVHFYDPARSERNIELPSISREVFHYNLNRSPLIKRNIFSHKWVLKINENQEDEKERFRGKVLVYIWVFCCIIVAIGFGIYFTIESRYFPSKVENTTSTPLPKEDITVNTLSISSVEMVEEHDEREDHIRKLLLVRQNPTGIAKQNNIDIQTLPSPTSRVALICSDCLEGEEICMKMEEFHTPICVKIRDRRDPSGCGGICELNTQHCKRLHSKMDVFQCIKNKDILYCPEGGFSCGNMCILEVQRCDGVIHCSNMADEVNCECDMTSYFHCGNGTSCIENKRKCNGIIDCWDRLDELDCHRACESNEEPCSNGECIKKEFFCDGIFQCSDRSDEPQGC